MPVAGSGWAWVRRQAEAGKRNPGRVSQRVDIAGARSHQRSRRDELAVDDRCGCISQARIVTRMGGDEATALGP